MLPVQVVLDVQEALQDNEVTGAESAQIILGVVSSLIGAMVFTFAILMFNKVVLHEGVPV